MKKIFLMWMLVFAAVVSFSSCSDDDESKFDYPMDTCMEHGKLQKSWLVELGTM